MKQIIQNYKESSLTIEEVPAPALKPGGVLVQTYHSLISAGTEKMKVDDSKKSYLGMAKARPEQTKQVLATLIQQGPLATYRKVMNRLDSFTPLGYSLAGKVIAVADDVSEFKIGDMVACAGAELANHAEINWIPINLCVTIPKVSQNVKSDDNGFLPTEQAAFTTVGSIAMQGVRQAEVRVGDNVAVIGLGLVGLLACQILKAAGCNVFGVDIDKSKVDLAQKTGIDVSVAPGEMNVEQAALSFSKGYGMDAVLVTSGTTSNEPIITAGEIARDRGTVVNVGINKMDIPWKLYFSKELLLKQSRSYGPGRYDPNYEIKGQDYPIGYVRWTEKRNMESFLELMACSKIDIKPFITHRFDFENAIEAYKLIERKSSEFYVGVILKYNTSEDNLNHSKLSSIDIAPVKVCKGVNIGLIGAGNFARTMLLPHIMNKKNVNLVAVATSSGITAKDTARKFGFSQCSTKYEEVLQNESINAAMIVTRHNLHGKLIVEALKAGKNVYIEKPLTFTIGELEELKRVWHSCEGRLKIFVGFNRRFAPSIKDVKSFFGGRSEPMVMHYRINAGFMDKTNWYQDRDIGGGRIIGEVCHFIDTFQYFTDSFPVSVFTHTIKTNNNAETQEDNIITTLQYSDGSIGSITYIANGDPAFPKEYIEIFCEKKVAVLNNFSTLTTMANGKKKQKKYLMQDKGHKAEMESFIGCVKENKPMPVSFDSLYSTTLATFKINESILHNSPVNITN